MYKKTAINPSQNKPGYSRGMSTSDPKSPGQIGSYAMKKQNSNNYSYKPSTGNNMAPRPNSKIQPKNSVSSHPYK